jgi:peptide deformylase
MTKEIIKDMFFLRQKSEPADKDDLRTAEDLLDTLKANADRCVGMAANMIGVKKRILAFDNGGEYIVMLNPEIIAKSDRYEAEEGCLSLEGTRTAVRYGKIKVRWQTADFRTRIKTFTGFPAQIIQHEIDHFEGIII